MMYCELIEHLRETSIDFGESDHVSVMLIEAANAIEDLITALTASNEVIAKNKRKHGEWIRVTEELGESWMCSECMEEFIPHDGMEEFASYAHFCPNCGADMRGEDDV